MSNLNTHGVTDFESAQKFLGNKSRRELCFATTLTHEATLRGGEHDTVITVRHHGSPIVKYVSNGQVFISNAGWLSSTTTDRLHRLTPPSVRVSRAKGGSVSSPVFNADHQPHHFERVI